MAQETVQETNKYDGWLGKERKNMFQKDLNDFVNFFAC